MEALKHIKKIREYCDYVETHIKNVEKAWGIVQDKCKGLNLIWDDHLWSFLDSEIKNHDLSKLSPQEFIQYQHQFYPAGDPPARKNPVFDAAWENHKKENPHHWENWTKKKEKFPNEMACHCLHMVVDWMAMGMAFGSPAQEYYEKNKKKIELPQWGHDLVKQVLGLVGSLEAKTEGGGE